MLVSSRSKSSYDSTVSNQKQKSLPTKEKTTVRKSKSIKTDPIPLDPNIASKTLIVSDTVEYNIIEDMKNTKENISLHEMTKHKKQQKIFLRELKAIPVEPIQPPIIAQASKDTGKPPSSSKKVNPNDIVLIGDRSISHTPPLLLSYEIFNKNVHNCLIDSGAYSNIIPRTKCTKLNITPQNSTIHIVQLDRTRVEVSGEML